MSEASGSERSLAWLPREVRGEVEGKILQAASMGYQKGIAAGRAQTAKGWKLYRKRRPAEARRWRPTLLLLASVPRRLCV